MELDEFLGLWSPYHMLRHSHQDRPKDIRILNELKLLYTHIEQAGLARDLSKDMAEMIIQAYTFGRMMGFVCGGLDGLSGAINPQNSTYAQYFPKPEFNSLQRSR